MGKIKITHEGPVITCQNTWWSVALTVNGKTIEVSKWETLDRDVGVTDDGYEIITDEKDKLTKEEIEAVDDYMSEIEFQA